MAESEQDKMLRQQREWQAEQAGSRKPGLRWWQWTLIILGGLTVIGMLVPQPEKEAPVSGAQALSNSEPASEPSAAAAPAPVEAVNDPGISLAEFQRLQTGMSPQQVEDVVGSLGEVVSETELAGYKTVMVQWNGESGFGANANAMFQNGALIQKAQFGLK